MSSHTSADASEEEEEEPVPLAPSQEGKVPNQYMWTLFGSNIVDPALPPFAKLDALEAGRQMPLDVGCIKELLDYSEGSPLFVRVGAAKPECIHLERVLNPFTRTIVTLTYKVLELQREMDRMSKRATMERSGRIDTQVKVLRNRSARPVFHAWRKAALAAREERFRAGLELASRFGLADRNGYFGAWMEYVRVVREARAAKLASVAPTLARRLLLRAFVAWHRAVFSTLEQRHELGIASVLLFGERLLQRAFRRVPPAPPPARSGTAHARAHARQHLARAASR